MVKSKIKDLHIPKKLNSEAMLGLTCIIGMKCFLETFMAIVQRTGAGSNPRISRVVSKSDRDQGTATTAHRTLGLMPAGTICRSNLSLGLYPSHSEIYSEPQSCQSICFECKKKSGMFYHGVLSWKSKYYFHNCHPVGPFML